MNRKKFAKDSFYSFMMLIANTVFNFIVLWVIVHNLGTEAYGILTQFTVTSTLLATLACFNLGHSINRFLPGEQDLEYVSRAFSSIVIFVMCSAAIVSLGVYIFRGALHDLIFGRQREVWLWAALLVYFFLNCLGSEIQALMRARRLFRELSLLNIFFAAAIALLYTVSVYLNRSILPILMLAVLAEAVKLMILCGFLFKNGIRLRYPEMTVLKPYLSFGAPLLLAGLGFMLVQYSDRYVVSFYWGLSTVGIYSVFYALSNTLIFFWTGVNAVLLPDLSRLYDQGNQDEIEFRFGKALNLGMAIMIPAMFGLIGIKSHIMSILGQKASFMTESYVLDILCLAFVAYGIILSHSILINLLKKSFWLGSMWFLMAVVNLGLNFALIPKLGLTGAALSTLVCFAGGSFAVLFEARKFFRIHFTLVGLLKIVSSSVIMFAVVKAIRIEGIFGLIVSVPAGVVTYFAGLMATKFFEPRDIGFIRDLIISKIRFSPRSQSS